MERILLRTLMTIQIRIVSARTRLTARPRAAQAGQSLVEYALILAFVALVVIVAMQALQPAISGTFNHVTTCLNNANDTSTITGTTSRC